MNSEHDDDDDDEEFRKELAALADDDTPINSRPEHSEIEASDEESGTSLVARDVGHPASLMNMTRDLQRYPTTSPKACVHTWKH